MTKFFPIGRTSLQWTDTKASSNESDVTWKCVFKLWIKKWLASPFLFQTGKCFPCVASGIQVNLTQFLTKETCGSSYMRLLERTGLLYRFQIRSSIEYFTEQFEQIADQRTSVKLWFPTVFEFICMPFYFLSRKCRFVLFYSLQLSSVCTYPYSTSIDLYKSQI